MRYAAHGLEHSETITFSHVFLRRCYLITHPHLDHINGLVLSAGSAKGLSKPVRGTQETLEVIADVFAGKLWPSLASWTETPNAAYHLSP